MKSISVADLLDLPVKDRLHLAQDLWDSVAEFPDQIEVTGAQREELRRRLRTYRDNPEDVIPWDDVKAELLGGQ